MIHRVASALLVAALVSAGESDPFTRMPLNRRSLRQRELVGDLGRSVAESRQRYSHAPATNTLVGDRHHHLSVAPAPVDVAHPSVRVGATPALVELREAGIVPDLPGQPVPVAANTRPDRQPRVVLAARAPPV